MAFNVSALANYTEENAALLVTSSVLGAKTASLIKSAGNVMVGVKSSETINIMDTDAIFQSGGSCGFTASGSTTFTQRTVTVGKIKVNEALCPKDLADMSAKSRMMSCRHVVWQVGPTFFFPMSGRHSRHFVNMRACVGTTCHLRGVGDMT